MTNETKLKTPVKEFQEFDCIKKLTQSQVWRLQ